MKEIELSKNGKKNKGKYVAWVDNDVFDIVNKYNWYYSKGYAYNKKMKVYLHRFIWGLKYGKIPNDKEIEHIDQNGLNCQISNLRLASHAENICNVTKYKNNKSGVKCISKDVCKQKYKNKTYEYIKWRAQISKDEGKKLKKRMLNFFLIIPKDLNRQKNGLNKNP